MVLDKLFIAFFYLFLSHATALGEGGDILVTQDWFTLLIAHDLK